MTTMKVSAEIRDRLMRLARGHERSLGEELAVLVADAEEREWRRAAKSAASRLRTDAPGWAEYLAEADTWDSLAGTVPPEAEPRQVPT